ncbi:hypothetical protein IGB42_03345 [Andreprevotia sp. IGB-42]|uniref:peptidoglycan-binding protein n=1 Tax=Andreprevotia sp. IGB-42 TaxID=2497473 RepID=UPI00135CA8A8|nr:peptidoglycan-binding protein [Andreprevotia sp. IGB-42]KAF0812068.1 hypothetical protein IGB42_03345 [Andreprevotia sp. IGB-42]
MSNAWVQLGKEDSVDNLAYNAGLLPATLWGHAKNQPLRDTRASMHVLQEGDKLFVPAIDIKTLDGQTGQRHRFRRHSVPARLALTLAINGQALANRPCRIEIAGRPPLETSTDAQGGLTLPVMPDTGHGQVSVTLASGEILDIPLAPRRLDPVDTASGAQARLQNLGYLQGEFSAGMLDLTTVLALASFQWDQDMERSGMLDQATQDALIAAHGC